ncbi:uncharacterized protein DS421_14g463670 [Arachis hypogaea]|nr:uncharacterized protein DS421_14g463670 [Arachis hypogaea]
MLRLACHAFDTKWHAQSLLLVLSALACHAWLLKWHAQVRLRSWRVTPSSSSGMPSLQLPSTPSLDCCTSVTRHAIQVARPWICELFKLGVPCLGPQVARPSGFLELACHAFDTKWHAIVEVLLGMVSWRATPLCSSGTPIVVACHAQSLARHALMHAWTSSLDFSTAVSRLAPGVPRQCIFVAFAPKWHANFTHPASCLSSTHF